jgi:hypothetical protein
LQRRIFCGLQAFYSYKKGEKIKILSPLYVFN